MSFINDLELGQYYEEKYIEKRKMKSYVHHKKKLFRDFDVKNEITGKSYEIKADRKTKGTGNLFIEYQCGINKSGIYATKADYWIHFVCNGEKSEKEMKSSKYFYRIDVDKFKKILENNDYRTVGGGDGGRAKGFLVPEKDLEKYKHYYEIIF